MNDATRLKGYRLPCNIAPFVPHQHGMCLLDRLLDVGEEFLHAEITPSRDDLFAISNGIPGWVGLEWLAQAVAAWAGVKALDEGGTPRIGFLLGTRRYQCAASHFAFGHAIRVEVELDFLADNGLGAFRGQLIESNNHVLATAALNVFQPESQKVLEAIQQGGSL